MKLVTFTHNNQSRVGAVIDDAVVDGKGGADIPASMIEFLGAGSIATACHAGVDIQRQFAYCPG